jgi:citrate synthase
MTGLEAVASSRGQDDAVQLRSSVCRLSADDGRLDYRGYDVRELGERSTFEETAFLLVRGHLPTGAELRTFIGDLRDRQKLSPALLRAIKAVPGSADPTAALRVGLSVLALEHGEPSPPTPEAALGQGLRLIAITPTIAAAFHRFRLDLRPILPKKSLGFAANLLAMLSGEPPAEEAARAFDVALILRAENELNPSTYAARVVAATGADVTGAVIAALSALIGPRHGWHTRRVLKALEEIGSPQAVGEWVRGRTEGKIPGFGHAVYKGEDPRTQILRGLAESQCGRAGMGTLFQTARALEAAVLQATGQHPIVDFYLAPLYRALGIPDDLFITVFAVSRMPGWVAHVLEQYGDEKLIRPRAEYQGPVGLTYRPIRSRK